MVNALYLNTHFAVTRMPYYLRLKSLMGKIIKPRIQIDFENQFYQVKTVNCPEELAEVLRLRFEVFYREFSQLPSLFSFLPYDLDTHDFLCDHLVVKDKASGKIVASYRLLLSGAAKRFYSEGEFILDDFLRHPETVLELGRACVHRDFRSGAVISLLWKGLLQYATRSGARYLFGCSSIPKKDFGSVTQILADLEKKNALIDDFEIGVQRACVPPATLDLTPSDSPKGMSSLMGMYLLAGAKFSRAMAWDGDMECLDLLTILDMTKLPASFERKFG